MLIKNSSYAFPKIVRFRAVLRRPGDGFLEVTAELANSGTFLAPLSIILMKYPPGKPVAEMGKTMVNRGGYNRYPSRNQEYGQ